MHDETEAAQDMLEKSQQLEVCSIQRLIMTTTIALDYISSQNLCPFDQL